MNNNSSSYGNSAFSPNPVNVRSESFRRDFETMHMDQLVNQLRSERRSDETDNFGHQTEILENISINNSAENNFDHAASLVSESRTGTQRRNQARRPMTRAAGYDSRLQNNDDFFNLNQNSPRLDGTGIERVRRSIHLHQNQNNNE